MAFPAAPTNLDTYVVSGVGTFQYLSASDSWELMSSYSQNPLTTGDLIFTYKTTADVGFIMADDGSIGSASSGASNRANADTEALYTLLYNNMSDAECPVTTGRGASAAADFAANKSLTIPLTLGRAIGVAGTGASLTARTLGDTVGEETHAQTVAETAAHSHTYGNTAEDIAASSGTAVNDAQNSGSFTTTSTGSSTAFNVVQPTTFINIMVKL